MLNRKVLRNLGIVVVVAVLAFFLAKRITIVRVADAGVSAVPFVLEMDISWVGDSGQMQVQHKKTVARRSDGTTAEIGSVGRLAWGAHGRRLTLMGSTSLTLLDLVRNKIVRFTTRRREMAFLKEQLVHPRQDCAYYGGTFLGNDVVMGEPVAMVQFQIRPQSNGKYCGVRGKYAVSERLTTWWAPRLGCEELQYRVEITHRDGSVEVETDGRPTKLDFVEPDNQYFDRGWTTLEITNLVY